MELPTPFHKPYTIKLFYNTTAIPSENSNPIRNMHIQGFISFSAFLPHNEHINSYTVSFLFKNLENIPIWHQGFLGFFLFDIVKKKHQKKNINFLL